MIRLKKTLTCLLACSMTALLLASCGKMDTGDPPASSAVSAVSSSAQSAALSDTAQPEGSDGFDLVFTSRDLDPSYDEASATKITLGGDSASVSGTGAAVSGSMVTISSKGVYLVTGTLNNGQIIINAAKTDKIQLVLKDASITCGTNAPIYIKQADKVFLTLADGSENILADAKDAYVLDEGGDNIDGVIFSKADLTVNGSGSLTVTANYKHGIVSKDDLVITGGTITVTANGQGLSGKDCVKIKDGTFTITSQGDGVQSDNAEDGTRGFVYICGGSLSINAQTDAIQAETLLRIDGGTFDLTTGGGSANASTDKNGSQREGWGSWGGSGSGSAADTPSAKGLKSGLQLMVTDGSVQVDSSDDSVHCNGDIAISGGTFRLSSGDDGMHADSALKISGGDITISKSYEGLEGCSVEISGGTIDLTASDDGINAAGGSDSSSVNGRPGQNSFSSDSSIFIRISGGTVTVDASGDGLDSNGSLYIEGGKIYVNGPVSGGDGALDYDGEGTVSGGEIIAVGSSGMAQGFSDSSAQCSILYNLSSTVSAGSEVVLKDSDGSTVVSYTPQKDYQSVVISSDKLEQGQTYTLSAGGQTAEITLDSVSYSNGSMGGGPGGGTQRPGF